jgi:hypothetical protein
MNDERNCDRDLQALLGQANSILAGTSDAQLKVVFFQVLQEFFDNSNCWTEVIPIAVVPNLLDYQIDPISGRILRLLEVVDQNNVPQSAIMSTPGWVHFIYPYTNPQPMTAVVAKNVSDFSLECFPPDFPEWFLPQYGLGVLAGVLGNFMIMPGNTWTDMGVGKFQLQRFRDAMMHARVATKYQNKVGAQAWAYPRQFRTTTQRGGVSTFNVSPPPTPLR